MLTEILFFIFAIIAIAAAVMMVVHRNPIYSALFLIITLFAMAGLFVLLNAPFIAAVHVIIYAGAIMVLFLFVIMLLNLQQVALKERLTRWPQVLGTILTILFFVQIAILLKSGTSITTIMQDTPSNGIVGGAKIIGKLLFTKYLLPFEIASVLLLSAIIGAVILAKLKLRE